MLSLELNSGKIRVLCGKPKRNTALITDYFELDAGFDSIMDAGAPEGIGRLLRDALKERGITDKKCTISMLGTELFFRRLTLPKASPAKLRGMIDHSLNGIPSARDCYVDYIIENHKSPDDGNMLKLLLCGAPKRLVSAYYSLALAAELAVNRIDAQQSCICRLINEKTKINSTKIAGRTALLLGTGDSLLCANLIVNAKNVFERAVSLKKQDDPFDELNLIFEDSTASPVNREYSAIGAEVQKMMQFSLTSPFNAPVDSVYIYGSQSDDASLCSYISESLGVETAALSDITGLALDKKYQGPDIGRIFGFAAAFL